MFTCNNVDYEERGRERKREEGNAHMVTMLITKREEGRENFHIQWMLIWGDVSVSF